MQHHAVARQRVQVGGEVYLGVVGPQVIGAQGINHEDKNVGTVAVAGKQRVYQFYLHGGSAADIGVFAQDAAQVATVLLGRVAQQIVDQFKGGVLQSVALHAAVNAVVGLTQGPRPQDFRGLQALISEAANQEDSQHERRRIMRPPRAQSVQASGEENPEDQGAGTLQHAIPVAAANKGGQGYGGRSQQPSQRQGGCLLEFAGAGLDNFLLLPEEGKKQRGGKQGQGSGQTGSVKLPRPALKAHGVAQEAGQPQPQSAKTERGYQPDAQARRVPRPFRRQADEIEGGEDRHRQRDVRNYAPGGKLRLGSMEGDRTFIQVRMQHCPRGIQQRHQHRSQHRRGIRKVPAASRLPAKPVAASVRNGGEEQRSQSQQAGNVSSAIDRKSVGRERV